jgi:hypothetical protein
MATQLYDATLLSEPLGDSESNSYAEEREQTMISVSTTFFPGAELDVRTAGSLG